MGYATLCFSILQPRAISVASVWGYFEYAAMSISVALPTLLESWKNLGIFYSPSRSAPCPIINPQTKIDRLECESSAPHLELGHSPPLGSLSPTHPGLFMRVLHLGSSSFLSYFFHSYQHLAKLHLRVYYRESDLRQETASPPCIKYTPCAYTLQSTFHRLFHLITAIIDSVGSSQQLAIELEAKLPVKS